MPTAALREIVPETVRANKSSYGFVSHEVSIDRDLRVVDRAAKRFTLQRHPEFQPELFTGARKNEEILFHVEGFFKRSEITGISVNTLQEWQGCVEGIEDSRFNARIVDLTRPSTDAEFTTIPFKIVDKVDRHKIQRGALFHLIIGYTREKGGTYSRKPIIYFRKYAPESTRIGAKAASLLSSLRDASRIKTRPARD
ncbi:hypothetical protein [Lichenifustis flavocetrariae]|uniref:Uncharacterized protein n=1 Tax=Lichenifustis flavocetrariae TaxID=2949735 RepID=A0AA42CIY6_9HYPH|nr:hypothetical protein [Lichenifustis flavocetrariae]MCW6507396.1 hypothetical protein [Lichenifustis flavocetrariae]